ncbi:hypothetical protein CHUAL_000915 [Chamberlinius hualienensis]
MAETLVKEWLTDCKTVSPTETVSFNTTTVGNSELIAVIYNVFEDRGRNQDLMEGVCNQLFTFYRSKEVDLRRFSLQYVPTMIGAYLSAVVQGAKKSVKCIEILLLGIYNLEVVDSAGKSAVTSFRLPCVAQPSIYHTPISLASAALTENALSRLEKGDSQIIAIGPFPQVESLNAQNRIKVLTVLMNIYNQNLSFMPKISLNSMCKWCIRITKQGFGKQGSHHRSSYGSDVVFGNPYSKTMCRIPLSSSLLLELLHAVYFSMFNGAGSRGLEALDEIHTRSSYELLSDVLLVTNAIRNSIHCNPSGQPNDGPMGISISLSPTTSMNALSKSIITNASFRTRKLPDDIPIQNSKEGEAGDGQKSLATISEENDEGEKGHVKSKEKGMAPLIGMITKISEKTKIGKKIDGDQTPLPRGKERGGSVSSYTNTDGGKSKKDSELPNLTKISRKESDSGSKGVINGDSASSAVKDMMRNDLTIIKNQEMETIEMKTVALSKNGRPKLPLSSDGAYHSASEAGSLSSTHSSMEDDEESHGREKSSSYLVSLSGESGVSTRCELHTTV